MGKKNNAICDYLEKPDKFADFINGSLYKGRTVIKTEQVKEQQTVYSKENKIRDILRMVYKDDRYLLIGVENQEHVHYAMPIRCMEYDIIEYKKQLKELRVKYRKMIKEKKSGLSRAEFLSGMRKDDRLKPVLTIVFYHGTEEYDGCRTLHDMLNLGKENEIFRKYISNYHINLITLADLAEDNFQTGVRELIGFLKRSKDKAELQKYCIDNAERIQEMDEDTYDTISIMIDQPEFTKRKELYKEGNKINMCKAMADWKADILTEGIEQGLERGIQQGIERGIKAFILDNLDEGVSEEKIVEKLQKRFLLDEGAARMCFLGCRSNEQAI